MQALIAQMDGGYKYNLMGWPVTLFGGCNAAMEFGPTGVMCSSGTTQDQINLAFETYNKKCQSVIGKYPSKDWCMSDAAEEYRAPARAVFSDAEHDCKTLMCWFHVKAAVQDYLKRRAHRDAPAGMQKDILKDLEVICAAVHGCSAGRPGSVAVGRQILAVPSGLLVNTELPLGLQATAQTAPACPRSSARTSQSSAVASEEAGSGPALRQIRATPSLLPVSTSFATVDQEAASTKLV